jgi:hypothetical protein
MRSKRRLPAAGAMLLALVGVGLLAGCGTGGNVVLERGSMGRNGPWQLVASEQNGSLSLTLDGASQSVTYSGGVGFSANPDAGFWAAGLGPGNSTFYYGPTPSSARYAVLTASGYAPVIVATRPLPEESGLPSGRFFIVEPPGPTGVVWSVTLRDSAGRHVAFSNF